MKKIGAVLLVILIILSITGCSLIDKFKKPSYPKDVEETPVAVDPNFPVTVNETEIPEKPRYVVSLSAALVEEIYDLGLEENLVGVPEFLSYPPSGKKLDSCGTGVLPNMEKIYELGADLILTQAPLPEDVMTEFEEENIPVVIIPPASSFRELEENYRSVAVALEGKEKGESLGQETVKELENWKKNFEKAVVEAWDEAPSILYIRRMPYTVATGGTLEQELLHIAGFVNIAGSEKEWAFSEDSLATVETKDKFQKLSHIFIDEESMTIGDLEKHDYYRILPAVINDRYTTVDMSVFEHQGFRMFDELGKMAKALYPDGDFPNLGSGAIEEEALEPEPSTEENVDDEEKTEKPPTDDGLSDPEEDVSPV